MRHGAARPVVVRVGSRMYLEHMHMHKQTRLLLRIYAVCVRAWVLCMCGKLTNNDAFVLNDKHHKRNNKQCIQPQLAQQLTHVPPGVFHNMPYLLWQCIICYRVSE